MHWSGAGGRIGKVLSVVIARNVVMGVVVAVEQIVEVLVLLIGTLEGLHVAFGLLTHRCFGVRIGSIIAVLLLIRRAGRMA